MPKVASEIRVSDFLSPRNREWFECLSDLYMNRITIEPSAAASMLEENGKLLSSGGMKYLADILDSTSTSVGWEYHVKAIKENRKRHGLLEMADMVKRCMASNTPTEEILSNIKSRVSKFDDAKGAKTTSIKDNLGLVVKSLETTSKRNGIQSGFEFIDRVTGGWQKGELIIIAGRPGMGKSVIAKDFAEKSDRPVLYFSLEMSKAELIKRQISSASGVDFEAIRTSCIKGNDWEKIIESSKKLWDSKIRYNDSGTLTIDELCAITESEAIEHGIEMVVVDYLQLVYSNTRENREREVANMSRRLKSLARDLDISVICLSQLNRDCEKRVPQIPRLADLRESGAIEQDADIVAFLYRPWIYDKDANPREAKFIIAKSRNTRTGIVPLLFYGNNQVFKSGETEDDPIWPV
uniref:DNA 5'-3' helicase n=1 Tax=viral metagenome TaxID=1070528 RepID=A0A6H1ZGI6_9ZZZZ